MYLNYDLNKLISLLLTHFNYPIYIVLIIVSFILACLFIYSKFSVVKGLVFLINIFLIILICKYYHFHLISLDNLHYFFHNMYFYLFNSIIFLVLNFLFLIYGKYKKIYIIFYCINIIFLGFSLFMTHYLYNNHLVILGNIYPEIVLGNTTYLLFYLFIIMTFVNKILTKKK